MASPATSPLTVPVSELLRHPGTRRRVTTDVPAVDLALAEARVPDGAPIRVDVELESLSDGVTVHGTVTAPWVAECRRCLAQATGMVVADVNELYQQLLTSEDAFAFDGELLDLAPMVRETVLVELPVAALCRPDCAGLCPQCGADRNIIDCGHGTRPVDPRWTALEDMRGLLGEGQGDASESE